MNKDVIYVEPENDITDIITKIENSPEKIVVLVPPKKASVFRSVVNIKLIARAGATSEKTVVLVTVDPSIVKLAAASHIPVTKDLKTPPAVPQLEEEDLEANETEFIEETDTDEVETPEGTERHTHEEKIAVSKSEPEEEAEEDEGDEAEAEEAEEAEEKAKKAKKKSSQQKGWIGWIKNHKVPVAIGGVALVAAIGFLIWAFGFAPAVSVAVEIQTETKSFAENVKFTTNASEEDAKAGIFYIQEKKVEQAQEIKFDATGKRNDGDKAKGSITVSVIFDQPDAVNIIAGNTTFSSAGLTFVAEQDASLSYNGSVGDLKKCQNSNPRDDEYCQMSTTVSVVATQPGTQYNLPATSQWSSSINVNGITSSQMNGGTDKEVTIVEQIDVEKAKDQLKSSNEEEVKNKLKDEVGDNMMAIESSFSIETGNAEATPGVGQEVNSGTQPVLKAVTTAKIYAIDKAKLEEFIEEKANIPDDQKVYEIKDPFIESFAGSNGSYSGRLKANYNVGPEVTDSEVVEMIKGKGLGDVQHDLKNINGVVGVTIDKSYPWVSSVPNDTNKITVNLKVRENGEKQSENDKNQAESTQE